MKTIPVIIVFFVIATMLGGAGAMCYKSDQASQKGQKAKPYCCR